MSATPGPAPNGGRLITTRGAEDRQVTTLSTGFTAVRVTHSVALFRVERDLCPPQFFQTLEHISRVFVWFAGPHARPFCRLCCARLPNSWHDETAPSREASSRVSGIASARGGEVVLRMGSGSVGGGHSAPEEQGVGAEAREDTRDEGGTDSDTRSDALRAEVAPGEDLGDAAGRDERAREGLRASADTGGRCRLVRGRVERVGLGD